MVMKSLEVTLAVLLLQLLSSQDCLSMLSCNGKYHAMRLLVAFIEHPRHQHAHILAPGLQ